MKNLYTLKYALMSVLAISLLYACESNSSYEDEAPSIANIAVSNPNFSTLEAAAVLGNVAVTLSNSNPNDPSGDYTVFAPTNDAFGRLGLNENTLGVLQPAFLTNTLLYHVSNGNLRSDAIMDGVASTSAIGVDRRFVSRDGDLYINGSKILATDIMASNGTVHAIDKVMIATGVDIVQSAIALQSANVFTTPELSYLVEAVVYTNLVGALSASEGSPSFTVFAPSDQAFIDLGAALGLTFNEPADIRQLPVDVVTTVLLNHVVANNGKFTCEMNQGSITPLGGDALTLGAFENGTITVSGAGSGGEVANMLIPDVQTTNGIVHVIDRVLLPNL
ncbi:fasciclin domain-containing protein [Subsaximicrobium wynnwilliamsii]|uniref:Fasciclin domain-containing protein n=1 Tax=Subsaximicrobium wynnwilliamsii TaxID=291179 RepID=A0A5C6ZGW4_9FLAO|nr:fasciclin domain-containing protein [Subsaximicrobium wynnwilliamsii]TXD83530.1 fasciclin domain-containing protein [Subsaximicrobium wynnwilliamsii]TXD89195.1 fasciclin domain-containing protein [Subsaximicrobium wynnwilliamsii]TXE03210.1 fasciclin domain-containing protein [Subsaximicrobium wynnwilliamsii]